MEAYARYLHNLSAACMIGGATAYYSPSYTIFDVSRLVPAGVVLFLAGVLFSKGAYVQTTLILIFALVVFGWASWVALRDRSNDDNSE